MENRIKVLNILHDGLMEIGTRKLSTESLWHMDDKTGEMTKVGEYFGGDALRVVSKLKKAINEKVNYSTLYEKSLRDVLIHLKPNQVRVLLYFIAHMKYGNVVYGLTYRMIVDDLGVSLRSVNSSIKELLEMNLLIKDGERKKKVYYVNPSVAWKGSRMNMWKKAGLFVDNEKGENPTDLENEE